MPVTSFVQQRQDAEQPREMNKAESKASFPTHGSPDVMPRKMQGTRLSEIRWDALANRREQRRDLNIRGLPSKLCTTDALHAWLRAHGLGHTVENLRVFPGKAGRLGCAVLRARDVADVERLAKFFHGRQCGAGSPIAVSFAAQGGLRGSARPGATPAKVQPGATPAKVQSSLDAVKQRASTCLIPGSVAFVQSVPDLATMAADPGVLKDSRPFSDFNIHLVETVSSLPASRLSIQSSRSASSASLASWCTADSNCSEDCIFDETGQLRPPPGLEGLRWQ
jgi:hypothetical protein